MRAGVGDTTLGEGLLADVVGKGVLVIRYVCRGGTVAADASVGERRLERVSVSYRSQKVLGLIKGLGVGEWDGL